ncbi:hypothetical protein DPMN_034708 [Dreissena polymorpha]|uniref:GH18 domain-containing protein n=1 Tax=Dreissena polymorpha TaxID=45954 RepID=A0A9D4M672_DREPO|nr:hypothetical protein DPMN_034708 [Dreissena polymorpha]
MTLLKQVISLLLLIKGLECFRVVCSYTNWAQYRPGDGRFLPEDVDPSLCTHLIYVYAKLKGNKLEPAEWNDESTTWSEGMYQRVINLKDLNPEMKVLLGVGGWQMGSTDFSRMSMSQGSRRAFARSTVKFLRDRKFDGLSIDWQHPTKRGGRPKDKENFSLLLQDLRLAFDNEGQMTGKPSLMLSAGVSASKEVIDTAYEHNNITKYVDFLNVFAFDLHGDWDNYTGHPSQLYARKEEFGPATEVNVDAVMRYWMSLVPDVTKLVLGVSTYGRTFTLRRARHTEYNVPTVGPGVEGEYTRQPGMLAYYERCLQYVDAPRVWDPVSQVPYWHSGDQWIAGEDTDSIRAKVNWMRQNAIGGIMLSSLDMDDFSGLFCTGEIYPLLHAIHSQLKAPLPVDSHFYKGTLDVQTHISNTVESTTWGMDFLSTTGLNYDGTDLPLSTPSPKSETTFKPTSSAAMMQSSADVHLQAANMRNSSTELLIDNSAAFFTKHVIPDSTTVGSIDMVTVAPVTTTESSEISGIQEIQRILKDAANLPTHSLINSIISLIESNQMLAASSKQNAFSNGLMRMDSFQRSNLARSPEWAPQPMSQRSVSVFPRPLSGQGVQETHIARSSPVFGPRFLEPLTVSEIKQNFNSHQNALKEQPLAPAPFQIPPNDEAGLSKNYIKVSNLGYVA